MALDFTSSLYLGLRHTGDSLRPWSRFTTGTPAALGEPPVVGRVVRGLATLTGSEAGVAAGSTLHLAWDLLGLLATPSGAPRTEPRVAIYVDDGTYPILRWGVERAAARGVPVRTFPSHDHRGLRRRLAADAVHGRVPLVVCDGSCPTCGQVAPLPDYLDAVRPSGGLIVVDDTQALGVLGRSPDPSAPYGSGGGGSLRRHGIEGPDVLLIASLAKGFGVPMAVLAGSAHRLARFAELSETRVHCSPPSLAALHAAERALEVNRLAGDRLRQLLAARVARVRSHLVQLGVSRGRSLFPVQVLDTPCGDVAARVHRSLARAGVRVALLGGRRTRDQARLAFIVTASHGDEEIDAAAAALERALHHSLGYSPMASDSRRPHVCRHDEYPLDPGRPDPQRADAPLATGAQRPEPLRRCRL